MVGVPVVFGDPPFADVVRPTDTDSIVGMDQERGLVLMT